MESKLENISEEEMKDIKGHNNHEMVFWNQCADVLSEKVKTSKEMNSYAKDTAKRIHCNHDQVIQVKDYLYYRGNGWERQNDGTRDPLSIVRGTKFKDRVSTKFIAFMKVIDNCLDLGCLDILDPYIEALRKHGIEVTINKKARDKHACFEDAMTYLKSEQRQICELADLLHDEGGYRDKASETGLIAKAYFDKGLDCFYRSHKCGKDTTIRTNNIARDSKITLDFASKLQSYNESNINT